MKVDEIALDKTLKVLRQRLIRSRLPVGCWEGKLSSSALSTATAVFALAMVDKAKYAPLIRNGINWLIENHNSDGGWGDTVKSISNISTTMLAFSALTVAEQSECCREAVTRAEAWLADFAAHLEPGALVEAVVQQYGRDRSFSAPILTMCALAGRLGESEQAWRRIKPLPFELAICPHQLFKWLRLPVVSYALPALIAIGQASYHFRRPKNPVLRALRHFSRRKTLDVLRTLQPENGGFLEAAPITSFVVMSLAAIGQKDNEVVSKGTGFLVASAREDGSWPIDTNLAAWVTTLSINAIAPAEDFEEILSLDDRREIQQWLLSSQYRRVHPYTHAAPGGWAWTDLPGAVPDADDTAGALIALRNLGAPDQAPRAPDQVVTDAAIAGIKWLLGLQNSDGGIPTFCRGWSALPFDRSAPDLTAHALGAIGVWSDVLPGPLQKRAGRAVKKGLAYLECAQRQDGSWVPLWFGNQFAANQENPVYGTARVLTGLQRLGREYADECAPMFGRAVRWLLSAQNQDGGWGGDKSVGSSVEETALAVDGLCAVAPWHGHPGRVSRAPSQCHLPVPAEQVRSAVSNGVSWLVEQTREDGSVTASPIGLYFARLWYFEELYPVIFAVSALQKAKNIVNSD